MLIQILEAEKFFLVMLLMRLPRFARDVGSAESRASTAQGRRKSSLLGTMTIVNFYNFEGT